MGCFVIEKNTCGTFHVCINENITRERGGGREIGKTRIAAKQLHYCKIRKEREQELFFSNSSTGVLNKYMEVLASISNVNNFFHSPCIELDFDFMTKIIIIIMIIIMVIKAIVIIIIMNKEWFLAKLKVPRNFRVEIIIKSCCYGCCCCYCVFFSLKKKKIILRKY